jgi:hypothetical protein
MKRKNRWLLDHRFNVESQFGEDGIIEKIFEVIEPTTKWCVEFGAWDGKHFSNTYNLIANKGWRGVLIEGNPVKCTEIAQTYAGKEDRIVVLNEMVRDNLDALIAPSVPKDFDLLSIDIDGNDYHVWDALKEHKPKVVVIEFNPTIGAEVEFVQEKIFTLRHGTSILSMTKLAKSKGYELVCINQENAFYVDAQYFPLFGIEDNSIPALKHYAAPMHIFQGYDGTIMVRGAQHLIWYGIEFDLNGRIWQPLPSFVRRMNAPWGTPVWWRTLILRACRRMCRPRKRGPNARDWKENY